MATLVHPKLGWRANVISPESQEVLLARLLATWVHEKRSGRLNELVDLVSELESIGHPAHHVRSGEGLIACLRAFRLVSRDRLKVRIIVDSESPLSSVIRVLAEMGIAASVGRFASQVQYVTLHDFGSKEKMMRGVIDDTMRAAGMAPI